MSVEAVRIPKAFKPALVLFATLSAAVSAQSQTRPRSIVARETPLKFTNGYFETGIPSVPLMAPQAASDLLNTLDAAEDNPKLVYRITPHYDEPTKTLTNFERDVIVRRNDQAIVEGDIVCLGAGQIADKVVAEIVEKVIITSIVAPGVIATAISGAAINPVFGVAGAWSVAIAGGLFAKGGGALAGSGASHTVEYVCALVRSNRPDPAPDFATIPKIELKSGRRDDDLTDEEQSWQIFRSRVTELKRVTSAAPWKSDLNASQQIVAADRRAATFRRGIHLQEDRWATYQTAKVKAREQDVDKTLESSVSALQQMMTKNVRLAGSIGQMGRVSAALDSQIMSANAEGRSFVASIFPDKSFFMGDRSGDPSADDPEDARSDTPRSAKTTTSTVDPGSLMPPGPCDFESGMCVDLRPRR